LLNIPTLPPRNLSGLHRHRRCFHQSSLYDYTCPNLKWGTALAELKDLGQHNQLRLRKISEIEGITKRPLIIYAVKQRGSFNVPNSIDNSDVTGFADLIDGISGEELDVFIDSPGGEAEATERIVNLLRQNFKTVRFFVPHSAYSAATMLALSGDEIYMDDRSTLGPIDPQLVVTTPNGATSLVPTQDIIDAFDDVRKIVKREGPDVLPAFYPMLEKYDLHIFQICKKAQKLSETMVRKWLQQYMFKDDQKRSQKANKITKRFSDRKKNLSHSRTISFEDAKNIGLRIRDLRENPPLRQTLWELYCNIELYFDRTIAVKLFENSRGVSWSRNQQQFISVPILAPPPTQIPLAPIPSDS